LNSRECHDSSKHQQPLTERRNVMCQKTQSSAAHVVGIILQCSLDCWLPNVSWYKLLGFPLSSRMVPNIPSSLCLLLIQLSLSQCTAAYPPFSRHHQYIFPVCAFHCSTVSPLHAAITSILTSRHPNVSILIIVLSTSSSNVTVEMLLCRYLSSIFLNIQIICQSCLVTSDNVRHYQPLFPQTYFAFPLLRLLQLRLCLCLCNHLDLNLILSIPLCTCNKFIELYRLYTTYK